jgi:hypothetical protein
MPDVKPDPLPPSLTAAEPSALVARDAASPGQTKPMIDVHAPHHTVHTWRDFFVHIATIVVGLLIAVGLEQTVERIHAQHELRETREEIAHEQKTNETSWARNERNWRFTFAELKNDLMVLKFIQEHPGTPQTELPGVLVWEQAPFLWNHAVWDAAQVKGVVQRMPLEESNGHQEYYGLMTVIAAQSLDDWNAINAAHSFDLIDPDPTHLSPAELDQVMQLTVYALQKHVVMGYSFGRFAHEFSDRPHTITWDTIGAMRQTAEAIDPKGLERASALTKARIEAVERGSAEAQK